MLFNKKWPLLTFLILTGILGILPLYLLNGKQVIADIDIGPTDREFFDLQIIQQTTLLPSISPLPPEKIETLEKFDVIVTAYSSSVCETQGDPFITASGTRVKDGIVANNFLPFGTKIKLPDIFGDKIFVVEDRMHYRKSDYHIDVWFPSRQSALDFGAKSTEMEIVKLPR